MRDGHPGAGAMGRRPGHGAVIRVNERGLGLLFSHVGMSRGGMGTPLMHQDLKFFFLKCDVLLVWFF